MASDVRYRWKGDEYSAARPCKFNGNCSLNEVRNWAARARQWVLVAHARVGSDGSRAAIMRSLLARLSAADALAEGSTTLFGGKENAAKVGAYIGIAQQAAALADSWGPVVKVGKDGEIAYDWGGFRPELPVLDGPNGQIPGLDPTKTHPGGADLFAGFGHWAPILAALFVASQISSIARDIGEMFGGRRR